jgi:membrane associated rhomboid family serine protease
MLLLFAFGLYFGLFNAISITLSFLLAPWFGNDSLAVALVGGSPVISGIIGVLILGPIQRKSGKYKKWIVICMIGKILLIV